MPSIAPDLQGSTYEDFYAEGDSDVAQQQEWESTMQFKEELRQDSWAENDTWRSE